MDIATLKNISKNSFGYSKSQRTIAKYIHDNYEKAAFMTAAKIGEAVGVSESTVVRFAAELGYDGYPGMRRAMQEMIRGMLTSVQRIEASKELINGRSIYKTVMGNDLDRLQNTLEELDEVSFNKVIDSIMSAKKLYISGMRTSTYLADILGFYLSYLRSDVIVLQDNGAAEVYEQLFRIDENDLFIGITFPRYSTRARKAMDFAKSRGARTIGITDSETSPVFGTADICLFANSEMVSFVDSLVAPLSLVNAIIVAVGARSVDIISDTFAKLEAVWSKYKVYEFNES